MNAPMFEVVVLQLFNLSPKGKPSACMFSIARYREEYNLAVQDYNNTIQIFPNLVASKIFNFSPAELFQP
ncbi:MAG: LemA family protein [Patescibacteria group bacterium]